MLSVLNENDFSQDDIDVVGHVTNNNNGGKFGVIRQIEVYVESSQRDGPSVAPFFELPIRHFFQHVDGTTCGHISVCGPIRQQLMV